MQVPEEVSGGDQAGGQIHCLDFKKEAGRIDK